MTLRRRISFWINDDRNLGVIWKPLLILPLAPLLLIVLLSWALGTLILVVFDCATD